MRRYFYLLQAWLAFGLGLLILPLPVVGHAVDIQEPATAQLGNLLLIGGVAWIAFALLFAALSYVWHATDFHRSFVDFFASTLSGLLLLILIGCLIRVGFQFMSGASDLAVVRYLDRALGPAWDLVARLAAAVGVPAMVDGFALGPAFTGGLAVLGRLGVNWGDRKLEIGPASGPPRVAARAADGDDGGSEDRRREDRRKATARTVAVSMYGEAKALLTETEVHLTFLSLDVVGSTAMKQGEDPYVIEQAFSDYRRIVERSLRQHDAYKQTWTPDGQMAAFREPQAAIDCARDILLALPDFNRSVSRMRTDFRVRAGANAGVVSTDDQTPMEQISDFTIDVAGHMQKYADPDSIWLSEEVYNRLTDPTGIEANGQEVDGRRVFVWKMPP